ncbi:helix-turn-helix transcriptional regulator [Streptomyces pactum]|uniref:helix-turn-helix transcriptional regulator n=1 Tax=Streptomyces pactum TaxID=68249 RepID=UPI001E312588|nr:LuxR family transcriptional regulator [Streptomyces pactum]
MRDPALSGAGAERAHHEDDTENGHAHVEDDIAQELLAVRALIESTVVKHRDRQSRNSWVSAITAEEAEILAAAQELVYEAGESVDVVLAAEAAHARTIYSALDEWLESGGLSVKIRMLCAQNTLDWSFVQRHSGNGRPLEVRAARIPLLAALIVDGKAALVCADSAVGRRASAIRDPGVIETLQTLFDGIWRNALQVTERIDFGDRARTDMVRPILEWLRLGVTDEVAARELSVSVRTYRRYVAEIMALLGANSRFQAGVRAAELGLLPVSPPQEPPQPRR